METRLPCGCVRIGNAIAYCREHSEQNPPAAPERKPLRDRPSLGRHRWDPDTGELRERDKGAAG